MRIKPRFDISFGPLLLWIPGIEDSTAKDPGMARPTTSQTNERCWLPFSALSKDLENQAFDVIQPFNVPAG